PPGPDLQEPGARADPSLVEEPLDLARLALLEGTGAAGGGRRRRLQVVPAVHVDRLEQRRGVAQRRVQEGLEELVGQVVVVGDVAAGVPGAVSVHTPRTR